MQQLREANYLDVKLYDDALKLFEGRYISMRTALSPEGAELSFKKEKKRKSQVCQNWRDFTLLSRALTLVITIFIVLSGAIKRSFSPRLARLDQN